jgi:hypothetical protein
MSQFAPYKHLAAAIILQAYRDRNAPEYRYEIMQFFSGEWFEELAGLINLDPDLIREKLNRN